MKTKSNITKPAKVEVPQMIGDFDVQIHERGVRVGCTDTPWAVVERIYAKREVVPPEFHFNSGHLAVACATVLSHTQARELGFDPIDWYLDANFEKQKHFRVSFDSEYVDVAQAGKSRAPLVTSIQQFRKLIEGITEMDFDGDEPETNKEGLHFHNHNITVTWAQIKAILDARPKKKPSPAKKARK